MSITLNNRRVGDVTVIEVAGRITMGEGSSTLRETIRDIRKKSPREKIALDFERVSYIDSSGLGELVSAQTTAGYQGVDIKIINLASHPEKQFRKTKLHTTFAIFATEPEAVAAFNPAPTI